MPALRYLCITMIVVLAFASHSPANEPASQPVASQPATATAKSVVVEKSGDQVFFSVTVLWPNEGVEEYRHNLDSQSRGIGQHEPLPFDAIALIPQTLDAFCVFRNQPSGEMFVAEQVFVGKLRTAGKQDFLLRCPTSTGKWRYLPVSADFTTAASGSGIAAKWAKAELDFVNSYRASGDQSFWAYVRNRLTARLAPTERPSTVPSEWGFRSSSRDRLYDVTTGALALQESLQIDRMRNASPDKGLRSIPIDTLEGVTVKSHPWPEMIGDSKPAIDPLAALVPADQYYVRFRTTKAMRSFLEFAEGWGGSVLSQIEVAGRDYGVREKIETQICLKSTWLSELLGPAVIDSLAITGSDPYLREGSDFTVIFRLKAPPVFETAVGRYLTEARKAHADLQEAAETYDGISIQSMCTPDLRVRCFRARFDEYCVYSNSPAAVRRVIDARGNRTPSLAQNLDFTYMRILYPLDAPQEDGFIFLSDPFIRTLVGPRVRIAEKRRLETVTSLEMIKNAALFYLWEHPGAAVPDLPRLYQQGYLSSEYVVSEPGDTISWDPTAFTASSSRYGRLGHLTPIAETVVEQVTETEKTEYERFRTNYQQYWRRYFDPIGIRMTTGRDISLSVTILPLIDQSAYAELMENFGGNTTRLAPVNQAGPDVIHFVAHLNPKSRTLRELQNFMVAMMPGNQSFDLGWIGQRLEFWMEDSDALASVVRDGKVGEAFKTPITLGVQVKNPLSLAGFLVALQALVKTSAPNVVTFEPTEPYRDAVFTAIKPMREGPMAEEEGWKDAAIYYGVVGGYLYFSTSLDTLHRLVNAARDGVASSRPATAATDPPSEGHLALSIIPANAKKSQPALDYFLAGNAWQAEREHLADLWLVANTVGLGRDGAPPPEHVLGFRIESALGNAYGYDRAHDAVVGSITGSRWDSWDSHSLPDGCPLKVLLRSITEVRAGLTFTKDGLRTDLTIRRDH